MSSMNADLVRKLTKLLTKLVKATDSAGDIPRVIIELIVQEALEALSSVFDDEEGNEPDWLTKRGGWRQLPLGYVIDDEDWALCEDDSLWPAAETSEDMDGVRLPNEVWEQLNATTPPDPEEA